MSSNMIKGQLHIGQMTCVNCQNKIEKKLRNTAGIKSAKVSYADGTADITFDPDIISLKDVIQVIENLGYQVLPPKREKENGVQRTAGFLLLILALYWLLEQFGILTLLVPSRLADQDMGYGMLFLTGLVTSVHCVAMCGGINLSQCLPRGTEASPQDGSLSAFLPAFQYNLGRVFSYTLIGCLLGAAGMLLGGGQEVGLSLLLQGCLKLIAGAFMVITGINMLGIFPGLRRLTLRMPGFLAKKIGSEKAKNHGPLAVGILNGLMPCGPLQSMQIVALASGSPITGALSMFFFSLGTVPLMLGLGSFVSALGKRFTRQVMNAGAVLVVVLGLAMLSQGGSLTGFQLPGSGTVNAASEDNSELLDGEQIVNSTLSLGRYPNITVQAGTPVRWIINAPEGSINGCNYRMIIQEYGIEHTFQTGENVITFTPTEPGTVRYSCWMGMIHGNIFVTDQDGNTADSQTAGTNDTVSDSQTADAGLYSSPDVPVPSGYKIPAEELAVAEKTSGGSGTVTQSVSIELTDEGFSPAVIVVEAGATAQWTIQNSRSDAAEGNTLLAPLYSTQLPLAAGENQFYISPVEDFEVSTGDHSAYVYIKVVDDLENFDEESVRKEVSAYEPLIYPDSIFQSSGGASCCQ